MDTLQQINEQLRELKTLYLSQKSVLNFEECVLFTGISKSHLYKKTCKGEIPCYKPQGGKIYFDRTEVEKWLLSNKKKSNAEIDSEAATIVTLKNGGAK